MKPRSPSRRDSGVGGQDCAGSFPKLGQELGDIVGAANEVVGGGDAEVGDDCVKCRSERTLQFHWSVRSQNRVAAGKGRHDPEHRFAVSAGLNEFRERGKPWASYERGWSVNSVPVSCLPRFAPLSDKQALSILFHFAIRAGGRRGRAQIADDSSFELRRPIPRVVSELVFRILTESGWVIGRRG